MLASIPASILNQTRPDLGIPNRFRLKSSRFSPAMAAKVTERLWEIGDIVDVLEAWEMAHPGEVS
jgi:hypothetical protein